MTHSYVVIEGAPARSLRTVWGFGDTEAKAWEDAMENFRAYTAEQSHCIERPFVAFAATPELAAAIVKLRKAYDVACPWVEHGKIAVVDDGLATLATPARLKRAHRVAEAIDGTPLCAACYTACEVLPVIAS